MKKTLDESVRSAIRYLTSAKDYDSLVGAMAEKDLKDLIMAINVELNSRKQEVKKKRATIRIEVEETSGTPVCISETCPLIKECANHTTAGQFREEDGMSPNLHKIDDAWFCEQVETEFRGMLVNRKGKLIRYDPFEDYRGREE